MYIVYAQSPSLQRERPLGWSVPTPEPTQGWICGSDEIA